MWKEGDPQNSMFGFKELETVLDSNTLEYDNLQMSKEGHRVLMHFRIVQIALSNNRDIGKIIKLLWEEGGLGLGADGKYRTERIAFWKPETDLKVIITEVLNANGSSSLVAVFSKGGTILYTEDLTNTMEGTGMRDFVWWLKQGYQFDMVDPGFGNHPRLPQLNQYNPLGKGKKISKSFDHPSRISWLDTDDFIVKIFNSPELRNLVDISNPDNSISTNIRNQDRPYANILDISGPLPVYDFTPRIGLDFPVSISINSLLSNRAIQHQLDPSNALNAFHLAAGTIPYSLTLKPEFYQLWLSELIELVDSPKFQFDPDLTKNRIIQQNFVQRVSKLNEIQLRTINLLRGTIGAGFGQKTFAIWDVEDWIQTIIPAAGQRNRGLVHDSNLKPASYYNSLYTIAKALDTYRGPEYADKYIRSHLTPLSYFDYDPVPVYSDQARELYYNWRNIDGKIKFIQEFGNANDMWVYFDYPDDLHWVNYFVSGFELIAYLNIQLTPDINYKQYSWNKMNNHIKRTELALNNLANIMFHRSDINLFLTRSLSHSTYTDRHIEFKIMLLLSGFSRILTEPFYAIDHQLSVTNEISDFIHLIAPNLYHDFLPTEWSSTAPLFLEEFSGKPYFGAFGETTTMNLVMGLGSGTGFSRDISYIKSNEYRYLESLKITPTSNNLRPSINRIWGAEAIGHLNLPVALKLQNGPLQNRHDQFFDFVREGYGGEVIVDEVFGYNNPNYVGSKNLAIKIWLLNDLPIIYRPGTNIVARNIFRNYRPDSLIRVTPFFDNHQQDVLYEKIVGHVLDASIYSDPTNPLLLHEVLFGMRIPQNMLDWGIYNYFNTIGEAELWVDRIQNIFGIHVDPSNNYEFDYIINNLGLNLPPSSNLPPSLIPYYTALSVMDPNYNSQLDPFKPNFDATLIPNDFYNLQNNYKYRWWIAYINYITRLNPGSNLSLLMYYLHRNFQ